MGTRLRLLHRNRYEFLAQYHKRSNVETTFHMIKAKFGAFVHSRSAVAQVNEGLCKVLAHNLCVLVQSIFEFGPPPSFGVAVALRLLRTDRHHGISGSPRERPGAGRARSGADQDPLNAPK
jgi:hypothetical protein